MMDNISALATRHPELIRRILLILHQSVYATKHKIINTKDYGLPHNRPRLYLVAVKHDRVKQDRPFKWRAAIRLPTGLPLDRLGSYDNAKRLPPKSWNKGMARKLIQRSIKECKKMGINPKKTCVFTDVACTPKFYSKRPSCSHALFGHAA